MFAGTANAAVPGIFAMLTLRRAQISITSHCGILYANQAGYLWMQLRIQQGPLFPRWKLWKIVNIQFTQKVLEVIQDHRKLSIQLVHMIQAKDDNFPKTGL